MAYIGLATREYINGRISIVADRMGGYRSGHGATPIAQWGNLIRWTAQKTQQEQVNIAIFKNTETYYEIYLESIPNVTFQEISQSDAKIFDLNDFDLLYFIGLPVNMMSTLPDIISEFVSNGGGLVIEVPNIGQSYINILTSIENIYCSSFQRPSYSYAYWTALGYSSEIYASDAIFSFLTTLESQYFSTNWTILVSDIVTLTTEVEQDSTLANIDYDQIGESEFGISFNCGMHKGLITLVEGEDPRYSSSSSFSSSSSSTIEILDWNICSDLMAQWKLNENYANSLIWDSTGNMLHLGALYSNLLPVNTNTQSQIGRINRAISFNPILKNTIVIPTGTSLNFSNGISDESFSIAFWIYPNTLTGTQYLLEKTGVWNIILINNTIQVTLQNGVNTRQLTSFGHVLNAKWNFVLITYDTLSIQIYLNLLNISGVQIDTGYTNMSNVSSEFFIGGSSSGSNWLNGSLDNILIIDKILDSIEREALFNMGNGTEACDGIFKYTSSSETSSSSLDSSSSSSMSLSSQSPSESSSSTSLSSSSISLSSQSRSESSSSTSLSSESSSSSERYSESSTSESSSSTSMSSESSSSTSMSSESSSSTSMSSESSESSSSTSLSSESSSSTSMSSESSSSTSESSSSTSMSSESSSSTSMSSESSESSSSTSLSSESSSSSSSRDSSSSSSLDEYILFEEFIVIVGEVLLQSSSSSSSPALSESSLTSADSNSSSSSLDEYILFEEFIVIVGEELLQSSSSSSSRDSSSSSSDKYSESSSSSS